MSWDIYGNPLRRGYCEVHPDVHQEYPCSICMTEKQQQFQPHDELEQLKYEFAQQGDYIRKLESEIAGLWQKLRSAQHEVEALQSKNAALEDNIIEAAEILARFVVQIEVLRIAALNAVQQMSCGEAKADLRDAYDATPAQCLRFVQANAVMQAAAYLESIQSTSKSDYELLEDFANSIRRGEA